MDERIIRKEVINASLDVHPLQTALVIDYDEVNILLSSNGREFPTEPRQCTKVIRLEGFAKDTDVRQLAEDIVTKCPLVSPTRLPEIEQLLYYLQTRPVTSSTSPSASKPSISPDAEEASINDLDNYIDLLYEEIEDKERGAKLVLQLTRNPEFLEEVLAKETVLTALARVLREDWNKSMQLSSICNKDMLIPNKDILYIFFCFSNFSQFHQVVAHFKIGALCMTIIEEELKRAKKWKAELDSTKKSRDADDFKKLQKRYRTLIRKQDSLLRIGLYLLLNLSENPDVQFKMRIKGIVKTLVEVIITRQAEPVLILALSLLQRMSIFKENKDEMKKQKVTGAVLPIVSDQKAADTLNLTLRLLMNLSFDKVIRSQIAASHLIPPIAKLASAIETSPQRQVARCLLYQISKDEKPRNQLSYTDAFPLLVTQVLNDRGEVPLELSALLINCALSAANAELLLKHNKGKTLKSLIKRGLKTKDALIMKAVRNLSIHETGCKEAMLPYIGNIASNCQSKDDSFAIECIGTLANLNLPNIDYNLVLQEYDLVPWLKDALDTNTTLPDDIVLEAVLLTGTAAMDDQCAKLLGKENFVQILIDLLKAKQEDDEMVCQIVYVFYQLAFHQVTRDQFLATTAPAYLVDLMHDSNAQVRSVCDSTLDIIAEFDKGWSEKVRLEKFRWHNSQWLEMIEGPQDGALAYEEEEYGHPSDLLLYDNDEYFMNDEDQQMPPDFYPDFRPQSRWENSADPGWYDDGMLAQDYR